MMSVMTSSSYIFFIFAFDCVFLCCVSSRDMLYIPDNFLSNRSKDSNDMIYNLSTCSSLVHVFTSCVF